MFPGSKESGSIEAIDCCASTASIGAGFRARKSPAPLKLVCVYSFCVTLEGFPGSKESGSIEASEVVSGVEKDMTFPGSKESGSIEATFKIALLVIILTMFPGSKESGSIEAGGRSSNDGGGRKFPGSKESGSIEARKT